jgi:hypothetical protein
METRSVSRHVGNSAETKQGQAKWNSRENEALISNNDVYESTFVAFNIK